MPQPASEAGSAVTHVTIHRDLDDRQATVRTEILLAARALINEQGHEALSMGAVAAAAGVSRATLYRYFANKEHVIRDAALDWGQSFAAGLPLQRPRGALTADAVDRVLALVVTEATTNLPMVRAILASLQGVGPGPQSFRDAVRDLFAALLDSGDQGMGPIALLLGRLLFAELALLAAGDVSTEQCLAHLRAGARILLSPSAPGR